MITFQVNDMTCGHCAGAIAKAVRAVDAGATVDVDLAKQLVHVRSTEAGPNELRDAIAQAGYTPVAVPASQKPAPAHAGCCCRGGA